MFNFYIFVRLNKEFCLKLTKKKILKIICMSLISLACFQKKKIIEYKLICSIDFSLSKIIFLFSIFNN